MSRYFTIVSLSIVLMCFHTRALYAHTPLRDTVIKHSTDAVLDDWDPSAFDIHEASGIRMAADNDADKLYIAMYITNKDVQKRMMLGGMQLFVDTKAKKRESTFVEFPVQKTPEEAAAFFTGELTEKSASDAQAFREQMAGSMLFLKKTGFKGQQFDTELQSINMPNEIMVSFGWDERSIMYIEYEIPLSKLGGKESLLHKSLSLGFKLKSIERMAPPNQPIRYETRLIGVPVNGSQGVRLNQGGSNIAGTSNLRTGQPSPKPSISEQSFWLKHEVY